MVATATQPQEIRFLWHPNGSQRFSGFGLPLDGADDRLVGLLMVDRPLPASHHWLRRVHETFGDFNLVPMTNGYERGIVCQLRIEAPSLTFVRTLPAPMAELVAHTLAPLIETLPKPRFVVAWDPEMELWVSRFDLDDEQPDIVSVQPLFPLGRFTATPAALNALRQNGQSFLPFLERHVAGDWGDLHPDDLAANALALRNGNRLCSTYSLADGSKLWVITEWDRSVTTLLLPEDY